jgi:hypothetical protein
MENIICADKGIVDCLLISNVGIQERESAILLMVCDISNVTRLEIINTYHVMPALYQKVDYVATYKAGSTSDDGLHLTQS